MIDWFTLSSGLCILTCIHWHAFTHLHAHMHRPQRGRTYLGLWDSKPELLRWFSAIVLELEVCAWVSIPSIHGPAHDRWNSRAIHFHLDLHTVKCRPAVSHGWWRQCRSRGKEGRSRSEGGFPSSSSAKLKASARYESSYVSASSSIVEEGGLHSKCSLEGSIKKCS